MNLFENAKFGDWYMTSQGYKMRYVTNLGNPNIAELVIPSTGVIKIVQSNGCFYGSDKPFIIGRTSPEKEV